MQKSHKKQFVDLYRERKKKDSRHINFSNIDKDKTRIS